MAVLKDQVERPGHLAVVLHRIADDDGDLIGLASARDVGAGSFGLLWIELDRDQSPVGRKRASHPQRGESNRSSDLENVARTDGKRQRPKETARRRLHQRQPGLPSLPLDLLDHIVR